MSDNLFQKFSEEYFNTYLELNPQSGSYLGLHQYDGKIYDCSPEGIEKEINVYNGLYKKLLSINPGMLSKENKFDYNLSKWSIESALFDLKEIQSHKFNPMYYASMFSDLHNYINRDYAPFDERLRAVIDIIDKIPATLKLAEDVLEKSLPAVLCKFARSFSAGYEDYFQNALLNVVNEKTNDKNLISEYQNKSKLAITAFENFIAFLDKASSDTNEEYRLGKDKFEKMLRVKEHIDIPLPEIKQLGFDELNRLQNELNKVLEENNYKDKLHKLEENHPEEENLVADTQNMLEELIGFIRKNEIVNLPDKLNCIVTEMPKYMNFGFAAMNTAGPFEKSDESFYYVNLPEKEWDDIKKNEWLTQFNYPSLKLVSIHEAYPGHYTHFLNANKYSTKLSKLFMSYTYVEGWAHYTEEMMIEQGYDKDDFKSKVGMLLEALVRCCRYIVAIGIHCEDMSIQDAKNFFLKNAYMTETTAIQEAERGAFDPGYLSYTLGKIYLKNFRDKFMAKFEGKKTLKDFHDMVVSLGCPTYKIAERYILD